MNSRLNRFQIPFRFKCATAREQYDRTDAAVLYVGKPYFRITTDLLLDAHPEVHEVLKHEVPFFTRRIAPGLALAEDPLSGESFGQHRCRVFAETVWNCYLRGDQSPEGRLQEFRRLLGENGVEPDHPHLRAGSVEWFALPARTP